MRCIRLTNAAAAGELLRHFRCAQPATQQQPLAAQSASSSLCGHGVEQRHEAGIEALVALPPHLGKVGGPAVQAKWGIGDQAARVHDAGMLCRQHWHKITCSQAGQQQRASAWPAAKGTAQSTPARARPLQTRH